MSPKRIAGGGWYCPKCGAVQALPAASGLITCRSCGGIGLRGFESGPTRVGCAVHPAWSGWDDGGVNDDLARHRLAEHGGGAS